MSARKSHSKKRTARSPAVVERTQALIAQGNRCALMNVMKSWMETAASGRPYSVERYTDSYESLDSKLALRQRRYVLVQRILASQHPRFKSFGLLCMKRSWKGHKQIPTSQCDVIKDRYWGSICRHYNVRANASDREAIIQANGRYYISNNCAL